MMRQGQLFDLAWPQIPKRLANESWVRDPAFIEAVVAGALRCYACSKVLSFDDLEAYPVEAKRGLLCLACAAVDLGLEKTECCRCARPIYDDPCWAYEWLDDKVPGFLRLRVFQKVEIYTDPWGDHRNVHYYCFDCAGSSWDDLVNLPVCSRCDRTFYDDMDVGYHNDWNGFTCYRCWTAEAIKDGLLAEQLEEGSILRSEWVRPEELQEAGYRCIGAVECRNFDDGIAILRDAVERLVDMQWVVVGARPFRASYRLELWAKGKDNHAQEALDIASVLGS